MEAKKEARKLGGTTGKGKGTNKGTKIKRKRIWPPVAKWQEPDEVLTWEGVRYEN